MVARSWRALVSLAAGDFARARRETLETVGYFQRQGDVENQSEVARTLANIAMRERDWAAAERELDRSEALLRRIRTSPWRYEQPLERGRLALFRGDLPAAERSFSRYLTGLDSAANLKRFEAQAYLADTYARGGKIDRAERLLDSASSALDRWRATLSDRDLRIAAFQAASAAQNDRNSSVARVLAALAAAGRTDAAFALAERRRARELRDRLVRNAALEGGGGSGPMRDSAVEGGLTAPAAAELLPDDSTALLEYVTGALGAPTTAFLLTRASPAVHARILPPADSVTGSIGRFVALVAKGEETGADASRLGGLLVEPLLAELPPAITRLVIVPDGPLHRVPWDALRLADGRYLAERYAVGIVPSAATLAVLRAGARAPGGVPRRVLVFGDPAFTADTGGYSALFARAGGLPRLRESGREARSVAGYAAAAEVRLREDASEDYLVRTPLSDFGVVHFATHALVDDRALGGTALALAPGAGEDGFVTPGELGALRLSADMVVLSACRTAGGVVVDGEGIQGLTAPLLQAGARSVVATAWQVGDRSAARFIDRFYRELAAGRPVVEALHQTRLQSIRDGEPPKVWAAFGVVGDPLVTVPLKARTAGAVWVWWIAAAGMLLAAAAAAQRRSQQQRRPPY
jgi:tetratricopeptide (TPR) repeat protein